MDQFPSHNLIDRYVDSICLPSFESVVLNRPSQAFLLDMVQLLVKPFLRHQFLMRSMLHQLSIFQYENLVCIKKG